MEAAISHLPRSRARHAEQELEQLRPLGQAFLRRRFGGSISAADAEDAVAEVIIRLHRRIESGRAPDNLRAAFFTSVRNAAIDQLRARASRPTVALEAAADAAAPERSPGECAEQRYDSLRLREVIARMRPNYREALLLRFGAGLTVPEIGERLGISLPAAKKLVLRATEQARQRLAAIEAEQFCPQMQELARRSLIDRQLAGLTTKAERALLRTHLEHCGKCKSFLAGLQRNLHELGSAALLIGIGGEQLGASEHLARLLGTASHGADALAAKARLSAYKAAAALQPGDGGIGALAGPTQKLAAICGATATSACLATGILGPGVGAIGAHSAGAAAHPSQPAQVRQLSEPAAEPTYPIPAEPAPESEAPPSTSASPPDPEKAEPAPSPSEQAAAEFSPESEPEPAPSPEPAGAPAAASAAAAPTGAGADGAGGGAESFGFGG